MCASNSLPPDGTKPTAALTRRPVTGQMIGRGHHHSHSRQCGVESAAITRVRQGQHRALGRLGQHVEVAAEAMGPLPGGAVEIAVSDRQIEPLAVNQIEQLLDRLAPVGRDARPLALRKRAKRGAQAAR